MAREKKEVENVNLKAVVEEPKAKIIKRCGVEKQQKFGGK